MAKRFFWMLLFFAGFNPALLRADTPTPQPASDPSFEMSQLAKSHNIPWPFAIVVYNYKDEHGKRMSLKTTYKNLSPELQNRDWECWVDFNEVDNCEALH
jgi:hypothetical protein